MSRRCRGQLTATLQLDAADHAAAAGLLPMLESKVGRILVNGWPTGVEVCPAMVHGGPYPATSDSRTTSVGTLAIERFLRPVCYQDVPQDLLPPELRDDHPSRFRRLVDGEPRRIACDTATDSTAAAGGERWSRRYADGPRTARQRRATSTSELGAKSHRVRRLARPSSNAHGLGEEIDLDAALA